MLVCACTRDEEKARECRWLGVKGLEGRSVERRSRIYGKPIGGPLPNPRWLHAASRVGEEERGNREREREGEARGWDRLEYIY